jgi:colicin import membrane protein
MKVKVLVKNNILSISDKRSSITNNGGGDSGGSVASADGGAGGAEKSQGPRGDNSYARKIAGLVKSHTLLPKNDIAGNPSVEFLIELQPDGVIQGEPKMTKSSGFVEFDQAVKQAIEKSAPFPPDPNTGKVPSSIGLSHRLN